MSIDLVELKVNTVLDIIISKLLKELRKCFLINSTQERQSLGLKILKLRTTSSDGLFSNATVEVPQLDFEEMRFFSLEQ